MDPDVALAAMRAAMKRIAARYAAMNAVQEGDAEQPMSLDRFDELNDDDREVIHECAEALDGWLSSGGLLPEAWRR